MNNMPTEKELEKFLWETCKNMTNNQIDALEAKWRKERNQTRQELLFLIAKDLGYESNIS
jgi:uncharacterized protein YihD (DUF1040 family)